MNKVTASHFRYRSSLVLLFCILEPGISKKRIAWLGGLYLLLPMALAPAPLPAPIRHVLHKLAASHTVAPAASSNSSSSATPMLIPATARSPAMVCSQVYGMDGKAGLLCKPLPSQNVSALGGVDSTSVAVKQLADDVAKQAKILGAEGAGGREGPALHMEPAVYSWQKSSSFVFVSNKRHYYNVHYADASALKIKTGQDFIMLGPYKVCVSTVEKDKSILVWGMLEARISCMPFQLSGSPAFVSS